MKISTPQLYSILLYGAADMCIFLLLLNCVLIHMQDGKTKSTIILVVFLAMMGGSATLGLLFYRLPFLGSIVVPSLYGRRFDHGHFVVNSTHLFVSSGIGVSSPQFRLYCRPDIFVVDVLAGTGESDK
jgi:hypothetical protein